MENHDLNIEFPRALWLSGTKSKLVRCNPPIDGLDWVYVKGNMSNETFFKQAIAQIVAMHEKKAHDYTSGGEFGNFEESAKSADIEVYQAIEALIATKEARIRTIHRNHKNGKDIVNEPLLDSYLDRAVYAIISYAYVLSQQVEVSTKYEKQYEAMLKSQENITPGAYLGGKR